MLNRLQSPFIPPSALEELKTFGAFVRFGREMTRDDKYCIYYAVLSAVLLLIGIAALIMPFVEW